MPILIAPQGHNVLVRGVGDNTTLVNRLAQRAAPVGSLVAIVVGAATAPAPLVAAIAERVRGAARALAGIRQPVVVAGASCPASPSVHLCGCCC